MVRLIDADALVDAFYKVTSDGDKAEFCVSVVQNAPTIDAIPVKWWEDLIDLYRVANPSFNEDVDLIEEFLEDWREQNALN